MFIKQAQIVVYISLIIILASESEKLYKTEEFGFNFMDSLHNLITGHKYTFIFPSKAPLANTNTGANLNGYNNILTSSNFKLMHQEAFNTSNWDGNNSAGYLNTSKYFTSTQGWNIVGNNIEFTPNADYITGWDYSGHNWDLGDARDYMTHRFFNSNAPTQSAGCRIDRYNKVQTLYPGNSLVYDFLQKVVTSATTSTSKTQLLNDFNNNIIQDMETFRRGIPAISHKTTSYIDSNGNTVPQQDARFINMTSTDNSNHREYRIYLPHQSGREAYLNSDGGYGNYDGSSWNYWYNENQYGVNYVNINSESGTDVEERTTSTKQSYDTHYGGKMIITWFHKGGPVPNYFNLFGNIQNLIIKVIIILENKVLMETIGSGLNEIIAFDSFNDDLTKSKFIRHLNKKWQVYKTNNSSRTNIAQYVTSNPSTADLERTSKFNLNFWNWFRTIWFRYRFSKLYIRRLFR